MKLIGLLLGIALGIITLVSLIYMPFTLFYENLGLSSEASVTALLSLLALFFTVGKVLAYYLNLRPKVGIKSAEETEVEGVFCLTMMVAPGVKECRMSELSVKNCSLSLEKDKASFKRKLSFKSAVIPSSKIEKSTLEFKFYLICDSKSKNPPSLLRCRVDLGLMGVISCLLSLSEEPEITFSKIS